jgi:putative transposase
MGYDERMRRGMGKMLNQTVARVLKWLHYPLDVMLTYVRWYVAYPQSLRHLEEIMSERGISVDHSTVHRLAMKLLPVLEKVFRLRKRTVGKSWRMDSDSFGGHLWIPASWIEDTVRLYPWLEHPPGMASISF